MSRNIRSIAAAVVLAVLVSGTAAHALPGEERPEPAAHAGFIAAGWDWLLHWLGRGGGVSSFLSKDTSHMDPNGGH